MAFLWIREGHIKMQKEGANARMSCDECTDGDKEDWGCNGGVKYNIGPYTIDYCPEKLVTPENLMLINMWSDYRMFGDFPFPGHWRTEQPKYVIDTIKTLENSLAAAKERERE